MRTRLAPLTSLHSLTLMFQLFTSKTSPEFDFLCQTFERMIPILASFPPCLRRITFSFVHPKLQEAVDFTGPSWQLSWLDMNLRLLVPLLQRYEELEAVVFQGADEMRAEEKERILNDLPEFRDLIQFVDEQKGEVLIRKSLIAFHSSRYALTVLSARDRW